jgi:Spy/CpxP family protein refolding chaperone
MKTKLITLAALAALAVGGTAFGQDQETDGSQRQGGRGWRHDPMEHMTESLNLTADQKAKIQPILDEAKPKIQEIHREAMRKSKVVMQDTMAKIRPLLTPEQQKKLDEQQNERHGHRGARRGGALPEDNNG